jgi:hypothetical protein
MKSKICDKLGMEFPLFAFTHCRDVVAAVSNAGGFGVLGQLGIRRKAWRSNSIGLTNMLTVIPMASIY